LLLSALAVLALAGCGSSGKTVDPLLRNVDKANDAQALSSIQQGLATAGLLRSESGGSLGGTGEDVAARLQARDPSKRYTTAPSGGPDEIQVVAGGSGPLLLVAQSPSKAFVAAWDDGRGTTMYYRGAGAPIFTTQAPAGTGWSPTPLS
jgi:hypothetical protein